MRPNSSHTGKRRRARARGTIKPPVLESAHREDAEERLGYTFQSPALLDRALTHRSAAQGNIAEWSNERLEFLGDRVLGLVIADILIDRFPGAREGELAPRLNMLVSRERCAEIAMRIGLGGWIMLDRAERAQGGAERPTILSNAMEAIIGAVYSDGGMQSARSFIASHWRQALKEAMVSKVDPKTELQENAQSLGRPSPSYRIGGREGPDHAPIFTAICSVQGWGEETGTGASRQEAERSAARAFLSRLQSEKQ
jgi:ribonuclease-3